MSIYSDIKEGRPIKKKELIKKAALGRYCVMAYMREVRTSNISWKYCPKVSGNGWIIDKEIRQAKEAKQKVQDLLNNPSDVAAIESYVDSLKAEKNHAVAEDAQLVARCQGVINELEQFMKSLSTNGSSVVEETMRVVFNEIDEVKKYMRPYQPKTESEVDSIDQIKEILSKLDTKIEYLNKTKIEETKKVEEWNKELEELYTFINSIPEDE